MEQQIKILKDLEPFFKDNYRSISVRQYSIISRISPPTASNLLDSLKKNSLLKMEKDRQYIFYSANIEGKLFVGLSRLYWQDRIIKSGLIAHFSAALLSPLIIMFGSFSKAEVKPDSDIDIAIFSSSKTSSKPYLKLESYEKKLGRKIHLFIFKNAADVKSPDLLNNLHNGYILSGWWR